MASKSDRLDNRLDDEKTNIGNGSFTGSSREYHTGLTDRIRNHFLNQDPETSFTIEEIVTALGLHDQIYEKAKIRGYKIGSGQKKKKYDRVVSLLKNLVDAKDTVRKLGYGRYSRRPGSGTPHGSANVRSSFFGGLGNSPKKFNGSFRQDNGRSAENGKSKHAMATYDKRELEQLVYERPDLQEAIAQLGRGEVSAEGIDFLEPPYFIQNLEITLGIPLLPRSPEYLPYTKGCHVRWGGNRVLVSYKRPGIGQREVSQLLMLIWEQIRKTIRVKGLDTTVYKVSKRVTRMEIRNQRRWKGTRDFAEKLKELGYVELETLERVIWLVVYREAEDIVNTEARMLNIDEPVESIMFSTITADRNIRFEAHRKQINQRMTAVNNRMIQEHTKVGAYLEEKLDLLDDTTDQLLTVASGVAAAALDVKLETSVTASKVDRVQEDVTEALHTVLDMQQEDEDWRNVSAKVDAKMVDILERSDKKLANLEDQFEVVEKSSLASNYMNYVLLMSRDTNNGRSNIDQDHDVSSPGSNGRSADNVVPDPSTVILTKARKMQKFLLEKVGSRDELKQLVREYLVCIRSKPGQTTSRLREEMGISTKANTVMLHYLSLRGFVENRGGRRERGYAWHYVPGSERDNVPQGTDGE